MPDSNQHLRQALRKIAEIANQAAHDVLPDGEDGEQWQAGSEMPSCLIKALPKRLIEKAADTASAINPMNQPAIGSLRALGIGGGIDRMSISALTTKYWGASPRRLTVSFMETTAADVRARIVSHLNAWSETCGISFVETRETGEVRISREGEGYWSYLGTDVLLIPRNRPTMNLERFSMSTPEQEYRRVVRHEAGHTLGFPPRAHALGAGGADRPAEGLRLLRGDARMEPVHGRPAGAHPTERTIAHADPGRSDLDHVLSATGRDHDRRPADRWRQRHQRHRFRLRRPDISQGRQQPSLVAERCADGRRRPRQKLGWRRLAGI